MSEPQRPEFAPEMTPEEADYTLRVFKYWSLLNDRELSLAARIPIDMVPKLREILKHVE